MPLFYILFHDFCYNIYNILNDKTQFYNYLKYSNNDLLNEVTLIPTYDEYYSGENKYGNFFIKNNLGYSSSFNYKKTGFVKDLINEFGKTNQIQEIIPIKHIYGVNCSCLYGKIVGLFVYECDDLTKQSYIDGCLDKNYNYIKYDIVKTFIKSLIERLNFNGFLELEFIIDTNNKIYIMECNPRISGAVYGHFFFDWVILPYIFVLMTKNLKEINLYDTNKIEIEVKFPGYEEQIKIINDMKNLLLL